MRKTMFFHLFFIVLALFVYAQGITVKGPDLVWNMSLALITYDIAYLTRLFKQKWLFPILFVAWLAFFPNTFYMLTDLVHMTWVGETLWDRSTLLLFMAFVPSILFGIYCGIESWSIIEERLKLSWQLHLLVVSALAFLSSLAIYIGRYDRLNTWDLLTNPGEVIQKLLATFQRDRLPFLLGFTFIQIMSLLFLDKNDKR